MSNYNSNYKFLDMFNKKKLVFYFGFFTLLIFWFIGIRSRDASQYQILKQALEHTKEELKIKSINYNILKERFESICDKWQPNIPVIYAITPTYKRPVQKAELTRLSNTFRLVNNFHWIIVEDSEMKTSLVANLLYKSNLNYTHLAIGTPAEWKRKLKEPKWKKPRGVKQRNKALEWLRSNRANKNDEGIIFFADDDNTYSVDLFNEMRTIKGVGVWPVGLVGGLLVEKPLINSKGKVIGWNSAWRPERPFPVDMAGFAINLKLLRNHPNAAFSWDVSRGFQESAILSQVTTVEQLEPMADNCSKVYVWHTRTEEPILKAEEKLKNRGLRSDMNIEV
ncbi:galactosylgalactosylxylosylprotein 3-beta-glucuronosyltransferase I isoform X1 [Acyrthosiphon pisum]|uniref:Galactosylgalactosylxylosylprotein 3-beta-glucuronosyltransferase n=1 Tax=Acyrthosiphon pisum TaxID=7029 RepID=A0A8R1W080_ACYPI|nr:galactosylgalactosylxylosylprotein 3-beta-glucuronosyltransferase I isoform X1 [Acyrthosiphon pisum]|eukprot:XP_001946469.1 PREDICTED: galactosylgalactosylxylosylprotein 3-beta-glucuronosyltransferase I isoform X1 [Acyrthosiphon pisum]